MSSKKTKKSKTSKPKAERKPRVRKPAAEGEATVRTPREGTKTAGVIEMLSNGMGATVAEIQEFVGWTKTASVHGFLSGTLRKKLGLNLVAEKNSEGQNVYRIAA